MIISGVGAVSGYGVGLETLHKGLMGGTRAFAPWPLLASVRAPAWPVCAAPQLDGEGSRSTQLARAAATEALQGRSVDAVIVGGTTGGMRRTESAYLDGDGRLDAETAKEHPISDTAEHLAQALGARHHTTVVSACSSGLNAVIMAQRWIEQGRAERVLAIGVDALTRLTVVGFGSLGAIDPDGAKPFQAARKGLTIGEGAAAFVIERSSPSALARLLGSALIGEAHHATQPDPTGAGAARAMQLALKGMRVDVVSAHGTATPANDAMETKAIAAVLGAKVPVTSQKSQLGHTLGAAGAIELAACVLMLREQLVYPTFGLTPDNLDPACAIVQHVFTPQTLRIDTIVKNSFAFGGMNSVLAIGKT